MDNSNYEKFKKEFKTITFKNKLKEILGNKCINCESNNHIDYHHIVPLIKGGTNNLRNIVPLCQECHGIVHGNKFYQCLAAGKAIAKQKPNFKEGRPPKDKELLEKAYDMKVNGAGLEEIQQATGVSKSTLYRYIKNLKEVE